MRLFVTGLVAIALVVGAVGGGVVGSPMGGSASAAPKDASGGTTTVIFDGPVGGNELFSTSFVKVEDCDERMVLFVDRELGFVTSMVFGHSADGVNVYNTIAVGVGGTLPHT